MSVPIDRLLEVAGRARGTNARLQISSDIMRSNFEWAWGLKRGELDEHVSSYRDSTLVDILLDNTFVAIPEPDLLWAIYRVGTTYLVWRFSKKRALIQDLYNGRDTFHYLVLPLDSSIVTPPRVVSSAIPPHLVIPFVVENIIRRAGYTYRQVDFDAICNLLVASNAASHPTFTLSKVTFSLLEYMHTTWSIVPVPRRFLGLEGSVESVGGDESDTDTGSSTMEWEAPTLTLVEEPRRRLSPEELKRPPVVRFWEPVVADDEDDAISYESYVPGVDEPVREDYDPAWLKGVESWVETTAGVLETEELVPAEPIEDKSGEQPRSLASLDLEKPDYIRLRRPVQAPLQQTA